MSSPTTTTTTNQETTTVSKLTKLSPTIYTYAPLTTTTPPTTTTTPTPHTILLAFWMNAPPRALTKYIQRYQTLYPSARILTLHSTTRDFLFPPSPTTQQRLLQPAVDYLLIQPQSQPQPQAENKENTTTIHIHLFSNGGIFTTTTLLSAYKHTTGHPLPISSMIIDSAPGKPTLAGAFRAFSFILPANFLLRVLGQVVLGVLLGVMFGGFWVLGVEDAVRLGRRRVNEGGLVGGISGKDGRLGRRCYVYSKEDGLVDWRDVEEHAREAEGLKGELGLEVVRRERFVGSKHVAHMRGDEERYWRVVREVVEGRGVTE